MDLRQTEYVVAVADHGGFTRAARVLHVSQPALSQGVQALERELGTPLFHRLGRQVLPTPAGQAFLESGRRLLRDAEVAREAVAAVLGLTAGRLDVVSLPTLAVEPLVRWVGRFRRHHPGVEVHVQEPESAEEALTKVREGTCELGLVDVADDAWPDGLTGDHLGRQELVVVCSSEVVASSPKRRRPISELAHLPLVTTPAGTSTRRLVDEAFAMAGVTPSIAVETGHRESLLPLVLAGAGITFLPEGPALRAADEGAAVVRISPPLVRNVGLVRRVGPLSPAAEAFRALATTAAD